MSGGATAASPDTPQRATARFWPDVFAPACACRALTGSPAPPGRLRVPGGLGGPSRPPMSLVKRIEHLGDDLESSKRRHEIRAGMATLANLPYQGLCHLDAHPECPVARRAQPT